MKQRLRKCKAVNTAKGFESCGEQKIHHRFGLCKSCFIKWCLETEEGKKYMEKMRIKAKRQEEQKAKANWGKKKRKWKQQTTNWKNQLQKEVNKIVRLIDKGQPCIARNYHPDQIHAGHVISRGANDTIRFNLHNIHRQSAQSNWKQSDDGLLRDGIKNEYGEEYLNFIMGLQCTPALNLKNREYKELTERARRRRKLLEASNIDEFGIYGRIAMRNHINQELGIYAPEYCEYKQPLAL